MKLRVWRSYSCNNSSSYRLVARFGDPTLAEDVATELAAFFVAHGAQVDASFESDDPDRPTAASTALAERYGFTWTENLMWSDVQAGDEPGVGAVGGVVALYHPYCNGFGEDLPAYLRARGATDIDHDMGDAPTISAFFRIPQTDAGAALDRELTALFAQAETKSSLYAWMTKPPWSGDDQPEDDSANVAFFSDGKTLGFYLPIAPAHLPALKTWLAERGVESPSLRLCEAADHAKLKALAAARCTACSGRLEYLDPRLHGIEAEQLACPACGAMFDLSTFYTPPTP